MKDYKRKFQAEWMTSDLKPTGRILKKIQSAIRQAGKKEVKNQLKEE